MSTGPRPRRHRGVEFSRWPSDSGQHAENRGPAPTLFRFSFDACLAGVCRRRPPPRRYLLCTRAPNSGRTASGFWSCQCSSARVAEPLCVLTPIKPGRSRLMASRSYLRRSTSSVTSGKPWFEGSVMKSSAQIRFWTYVRKRSGMNRFDISIFSKPLIVRLSDGGGTVPTFPSFAAAARPTPAGPSVWLAGVPC